MNACYVCYESSPPLLRDICDCRTALIHPQCQQRLLDEDFGTHCKICAAEYRNIQLETMRACHPKMFMMWCPVVVSATAFSMQFLLYIHMHTRAMLAVTYVVGAIHLFVLSHVAIWWCTADFGYSDRVVVVAV